MKITRNQLRKIIREEIEILNERSALDRVRSINKGDILSDAFDDEDKIEFIATGLESLRDVVVQLSKPHTDEPDEEEPYAYKHA